MLYKILKEQSGYSLILCEDLSLVLGNIITPSPLSGLRVMTTALTVAISVILLTSNFTIINAQQQVQQPPAQYRVVENGTTTTTAFQSTNDSFKVQVPDGWVIRDVNNSGSALLEEGMKGYGILAQVCPVEEKQQQALPIASGNTSTSSSGISQSNNSCRGAQEEVIHIVRYPDLDSRLLDNNITSDNTTTDNILSYHLQKLQEVGYRDIRVVNSTETTLNLTDAQTNQTIATVPAKLVEMTYSTNFAPTEIRLGYLLSTATDATSPNIGATKGYTIFYEGGADAAELTAAAGGLSPLPPIPVRQVFDSFELIVAPEVAQAIAQGAQAAQTVEGEGNDDDDNGGGGGNDDDNNNDDDDDNNNNNDDDDNGGGGGGGNDDDNNNDDDDDNNNNDDDDDDNGGGATGSIEDRVRDEVRGIQDRVRDEVRGN